MSVALSGIDEIALSKSNWEEESSVVENCVFCLFVGCEKTAGKSGEDDSPTSQFRARTELVAMEGGDQLVQ